MEQFDTYIHRVLNQVHPDTRISGESVVLINDIVNYLALHISHKAVMLTKPLDYEAKSRKTPAGKKTIGSRDIQAAVRLVLPGELARHAMSEGAKAVTRYASNASKKTQAKATTIKTKAAKAGLQFSVSRSEALLRRNTNLRVSETAPIYLAGVLEYIAAEILELGGMNAINHHMKTIMPRHIKDVVVEDEEIHRLMRHLHIVLPGVVDQKPAKKGTPPKNALPWLI
jgi:histone H2B